MKHVIDAIVFAPAGPDHLRWLSICLNYCERHGYQVAAVATEWADVLTMLITGRLTVAVVPTRDLIPKDAEPRVETVTQELVTPDAPPTAGQRRVRRT